MMQDRVTPFQRRVLELLEKKENMQAGQIGRALWPKGRDQSPAGGGPSGLAVAASYQLGKIIKHHGWVELDTRGHRHSHYRITQEGRAALAWLRQQEGGRK